MYLLVLEVSIAPLCRLLVKDGVGVGLGSFILLRKGTVIGIEWRGDRGSRGRRVYNLDVNSIICVHHWRTEGVLRNAENIEREARQRIRWM
jgi:hypothetical protein